MPRVPYQLSGEADQAVRQLQERVELVTGRPHTLSEVIHGAVKAANQWLNTKMLSKVPWLGEDA